MLSPETEELERLRCFINWVRIRAINLLHDVPLASSCESALVSNWADAPQVPIGDEMYMPQHGEADNESTISELVDSATSHHSDPAWQPSANAV